jgi:2-methylcitrate dehydratase
VEVTLKSGEVIVDELAVADAHPLGARPFERAQYVAKFTELADGVVDDAERQRFLSLVEGLSGLQAGALGALNLLVDPSVLEKAPTIPPGIFR